ncbi:MAG: hypothetical protein P8Z73_05960 [Desulfobacteraceae bacterium]|jgi:hypothetical protein
MNGGADQTGFFLIGSQPVKIFHFVGSTAAQESQIQYPFWSLKKVTDSNEVIAMPPDVQAVQRHIFIHTYCQRFFDRDGLGYACLYELEHSES